MKDNIDYILIPSDEQINPHGWDVRILTGDYVETILRFGYIKWDGENEQLLYSFDIIYSPIDTLEKTNVEFQEKAVTPILASILENAYLSGFMKDMDKNDN